MPDTIVDTPIFDALVAEYEAEDTAPAPAQWRRFGERLPEPLEFWRHVNLTAPEVFVGLALLVVVVFAVWRLA